MLRGPMPRGGELMMRIRLMSSCGLTMTFRYASASLISLRS